MEQRKKNVKYYTSETETRTDGTALRCKEAVQKRIFQLCDANNLTLNALSRICGITQSTLNNIVSGRNNSTNVATIQKICDGLEIDLPTFFDSDLFRNMDQETK